MKKLITLFTTFLFLQFTSLAQEGWFEQISGTVANLNAVHFVNENVGIAVGDSGTILKTTNGGDDWILKMSGITDDILNVQFTDENTGWASGDGILLKTTNGGEQWDVLFPGELGNVYFINNEIGFSATPLNNNLLKTTNGGLDWDSVCNFSSSRRPKFFLSENIGWIEKPGNPFFMPTYYRTTDGGNSWENVWTGKTSLSFVDDSVGWACRFYGQGTSYGTTLYKTEDAGSSWNELPNIYPYFCGIFFTNYSEGWVIGEHSWDSDSMSVYHTTNGGESWNIQPIGSILELRSLYFTDDNNGWVVGDTGTIYHTTTGGVSFVEENEIDKIPNSYYLSNNYPNPFNPSTKINYTIAQLSNVIIKVFGILGNEIETLVNEEKLSGTYEITWYAEDLPSGVYFYQLRAGDFVETKKMLLLK